MLPELFVAFWATFEVVTRLKISCDNLANKVLIKLALNHLLVGCEFKWYAESILSL